MVFPESVSAQEKVSGAGPRSVPDTRVPVTIKRRV
jgi:hypothetical protein